MESIIVIFAGEFDNNTIFKLEQFLKVESLILLILGGIVMDNKLEHPENAEVPILFIFIGKLMVGKLVHPENAFEPILVIFAG